MLLLFPLPCLFASEPRETPHSAQRERPHISYTLKVTDSRPRPPSLLANNSPATGWITAHCDGDARGNPGPAGYGVEITDSTGAVQAELSEFLGIRTNNVAEYSGLLASLQYALDHNHPRLRVVSDSELMVKQIQGKYKVNSPDLRQLWQEAKNRIARLEHFEITHALRHKNKAADRLANEAMDRGMRRDTPAGPRSGNQAEGRPLIRSATEVTRVDALPLRAIPYPTRMAAPPAPATFEPRPAPIPIAQSRLSRPDPGRTKRRDTDSETPSLSSAADEPLTMLRGFTRDGVIHILGGHTLPEGRFVKIIPE